MNLRNHTLVLFTRAGNVHTSYAHAREAYDLDPEAIGEQYDHSEFCRCTREAPRHNIPMSPFDHPQGHLDPAPF